MKLLNNRMLINFLLIIFVTVGATGAVWAQSSTTKRLYVATSGGFDLNEEAAKDALKAGADINWHNDAMGGETMLIMAIKGFKEAKVIKFLLDNGADASQKDDSGKTALEWANQYNMGRNRNGREIIAMLETASGQKANPSENTTVVIEAKTSANLTNASGNKQKRTGGAPSDQEIKETLEKSLTNAYQNHFFGVKNKVTFEWQGEITVGSPITNGRIPKRCYPADLNVKVTMEDPRDGNQSTLTRGIKAKIGGFLKSEIFCFSRDGFGAWEYSTYEP